MYSIDLVVVVDSVEKDDIRLEIDRYGNQFDLRTQILDFNSPSGGWPEVRFTGKLADISRMLDVYCDEDPDDKSYFLETVTKIS